MLIQTMLDRPTNRLLRDDL